MPSSDPDERAEQALDGLRDHFRRTPARPEDFRGAGPPAIPRYEMHEVLGEGAGSIVWRARDRELGRFVAVKVLRHPASVDDRSRERFQREARIAAGITHPNVVPVHDAGESEGRPWLVMELVPGEPLSSRFARGRMTPAEVAGLVERAARGVAAAHDLGVIHRDLKPANILLTHEGEPKVSDFGIARIDGNEAGLTRTGAVIGTPLYMAPEQVRGHIGAISARTDVYALGAILYEGLTGRPPHEADTVTDIYAQIVGVEPPSPRTLVPSLPRDLELICLKALEKEPARRYADAREFGEDLRRWREGELVLVRAPGRWTVAAKWVRRHRTASILVASASALAVVAGLSARWVAKSAVEMKRVEDKAAPGNEALRRKERFEEAKALLETARAGRRRAETAPAEIVRALAESRVRLEELAAAEPGRIDLHHLLGRVCQLQGDDAAAERAHGRAVDIDATGTSSRLDLAFVWWTRAARHVAAVRPPERAAIRGEVRALHERAHEAVSGTIGGTLMIGHQLDHYAPASTIFMRDSLGRYDADTDAMLRSWITRLDGGEEEGILRWMRALHVAEPQRSEELDLAAARLPHDADILMSRAALRISKGDYAGAQVDVDRAVAVAPAIAEAWVLRARVERALGRPDAAAADFRKALEMAPAAWPPREAVKAMLEKAGDY